MGALGRFLDAARDGLGAAAVVTDPDVTAGQVVDWTGRFRGATAAVVRPSSADDVAAVVRLARSHGVALVPPGGNTGLVGGPVPPPGEVVVGHRRPPDLGPADEEAHNDTPRPVRGQAG